MRIMVATLYCGENEFDECRESILRQSYSNFEHVVIKEAHTVFRGGQASSRSTSD